MMPERTPAEQSEICHLAPGTRLDRYRLLVEIATGGMGSVWLAQIEGKHGFQKLVAIKTILKRFAASESFKRMFLNEASIAARIDHPNVARILELGEANGIVFLVMEWVDGAGLDELRRRVRQSGATLPLAVALRLVADVASGLHAAHELVDPDGKPMQVVHRDISPNNILISRSGVPKVIDFGVAKAESGGVNTTFGTLKGKLRYMAPEQALGIVAVDRRADIWALGAVLYELVEGRGLHEGMNDMAILRKLTTSYELPAFSNDVPPPIAAILARCLAGKRHERYSTAAELRNALEDAAAALSLRARSEDIAALLGQVLGREIDARRAAYERSARTPAPSIKTEAATPAGLRGESVSISIDDGGARTSVSGSSSTSIAPNVIDPDAHGTRARTPLRLQLAAALAVAAVVVVGVLVVHGRGKGEAMAASASPPPPMATASSSVQARREAPVPAPVDVDLDDEQHPPPVATSDPRPRTTTPPPPPSPGVRTRGHEPVGKVVVGPRRVTEPRKSSALQREAESSWRSTGEL